MTLFLSLIFGGVGAVYLALAKKEHDVTYLVCGFALIVYPYFVGNIALVILLGAGLIVFPIGKAKGWF
jgi:general stress protein CsbA